MIAKDSTERFVAYWLSQAGSERSQCHQFWDSLLGEVLCLELQRERAAIEEALLLKGKK